MKNTLPALIPVIAALLFVPTFADATTNAGNFGGGTGSAVLGGGAGTNSGVAIGTGYANIDLAPTNGLIVQGNVGFGTPSPNVSLEVTGNTTALPAPTFSSQIQMAGADSISTAITMDTF